MGARRAIGPRRPDATGRSMPESSDPRVEIVDLVGPDRELGVPIVLDCYTGIYRWHAKRTLREVGRVRAARRSGVLLGIAMLEQLEPEVGYLYYLLVPAAHRGERIGRLLFDDFLAAFRATGSQVVYVATHEDNAPMMHLLSAAGFRPVGRMERSYREGGLGAWGLRTRMRVVPGEVLLGLRLEPPAPRPPAPDEP